MSWLTAQWKVEEADFASWAEAQVLMVLPEPKLKLGRKKVPYNIANIVEVMTRGRSAQSQEDAMTFGEELARASVAKSFRSLETMRMAAGNQIKSGKELEIARSEARAIGDDYRSDVIKYFTLTNWKGNVDTFGALDSSMKAIADYIGKKKGGLESFKASLNRFDFKDVPNPVIKKGIKAAEAMLSAPVPYFESKPQRAVDLSEFSAAVVPKDQADKARKILEPKGVRVVTYDGIKVTQDQAIRQAAEESDVFFNPQAMHLASSIQRKISYACFVSQTVLHSCTNLRTGCWKPWATW